MDAVECWIAAMREAGREVPEPSETAVGIRTISIDDVTYRNLVEEAARLGTTMETVTNIVLLHGLMHRRAARKPAPERAEQDG